MEELKKILQLFGWFLVIYFSAKVIQISLLLRLPNVTSFYWYSLSGFLLDALFVATGIFFIKFKPYAPECLYWAGMLFLIRDILSSVIVGVRNSQNFHVNWLLQIFSLTAFCVVPVFLVILAKELKKLSIWNR